MIKRNWRLYIEDMIGFCEATLSYTVGIEMHEFVEDKRTYDATLRNMQLIGEAATHIPNEIRDTFSNIQWRQIIGTRNRLIHAYLGIDNDVVWDIIENDVPQLMQDLKILLNVIDEEHA